jgi:arylsulfatase A-like enzyme
MSARANQVIAELDPVTPLFLQLHYLPPHQPYAPKLAFDVFRDRDYRGPITPRMSLRGYRRHRERLTDADVAQLIDLYDGNLLMVDDAVQQVLDALKAAGRWPRSVILLTSDHGEAFWEHGHQGHNSTLYDEMLHIPFILRLPGDRRPAGIDLSRLVTLDDVVPTLLALVGTEPPAGTVGIDLLSAPPPDPRRPRVVFHRTGAGDATYAVRTPRFKAIVPPEPREQALYDLRADPGERDNVIERQPQVYADLVRRLRRHLARAAHLDEAAEEVELPQEDVEVLKSLGYLP